MNPEVVHVVPLNDLKPHLEGSTYCHCQPRLQQESKGIIVVHNAYDGREFFEQLDDTNDDNSR